MKGLAMRRPTLAEGSSSGNRMEAAAVRALDAYIVLGKKADRLADEMDQVTRPGVVRAQQLSKDDSLVIALRDFAPDPDGGPPDDDGSHG